MTEPKEAPERTVTIPNVWPPTYVVPLQVKPVKRKHGTYTTITFYMPSRLCRMMNLNGSELIGIYPCKRAGRDDAFFGLKLTQEEVAKLPNNGKRRQHKHCKTCQKPSSLDAVYCQHCGQSFTTKPRQERVEGGT